MIKFAFISSISAILIKLVFPVLIAFYSFLRPFWILPESEQPNCAKAVESWYNSQIEKINDLPLSIESKIAGVESYRLEANKQLERLCKW